MIKKIKDLTKEELHSICKNTLCSKCPLNIEDGQICLKIYIRYKEQVNNKLEEEIEIEDENESSNS